MNRGMIVMLAAALMGVASANVKECPIAEKDTLFENTVPFYDCAEKELQCGADSYIMGYGRKYALRFVHETRPKMSDKGKAWIDGTLICLQEELRAAIDNNTPCDDILKIAYDTHPKCYVYNGFCKLNPFDILRVVKTIDKSEFFDRDFHKQVLSTAGLCLRGKTGPEKN